MESLVLAVVFLGLAIINWFNGIRFYREGDHPNFSGFIFWTSGVCCVASISNFIEYLGK